MVAWVHRSHRAHLNLIEQFVPFAAIVLVAHVAHVSTPITRWAVITFFWLRVDAAKRTMAFRVGKATCFALAKKLLDDWSQDDLEKATSPESLSMAADDYRQSIGDGKKWIKK